jgi:hypothetical protein
VIDKRKQFHLRVKTCIGTIIEVHQHIKIQYRNEAFISQFEKLKNLLDDFDLQDISEQDIIMVEKSTNALLYEFRPLFEEGGRRKWDSRQTLH